jgi:predicted ATPase/DNA-binding SARP family transcriptional activator
VAVAGTAVDHTRWQRRKTRHLAALLALQPHHRLHKEEIQDLLFPELDAEQAAAALRKLVHDARHGLEPRLRAGAKSRFVRTEGELVWLEAPGGVEVDVEEFERQASAALAADDRAACEAAVALYTGDLLIEDPYEDWCVARRAYARGRWTDLVRALARHGEREGDLVGAAEWHERLLARDAADEKAYRALMRLAAEGGDKEGVRRQFERCREALERELGCEPEPETRALRDRLLRAPTVPLPPPPVRPEPEPRDERPTADLPSLPRFATTFVGREREISEVLDALASARLVTLTGIGGTGKTRLAVEAARRWSVHAPAWFVDLAPLTDPSLVAHAAASAVGAMDRPGSSAEASLCEAIGGREGLVVLDNCEHVVDACAALASVVLRRCDRVAVLATSREPLGLAGEVTWSVQVLDEPEAVRLFADRAKVANPRFALTNANMVAVASLCRELDGLPLAIELAAAHTRALSVGEIVARLGERFTLLKSHGRLTDERHRTLRATMDWSYALLLESERVALRRLAVFAGGWTLEAAEAICAGRGLDAAAVLPHLERLLDKSLLVAEERDGTTRYRMLETVRLYALEKLHRSGEEAEVRRRHFAWYHGLTEASQRDPDSSDEIAWFARFDAEIDNLRSALQWGIGQAGDPTGALEMCWHLGRYLDVRVRAEEAERIFDAALAAARDAPPALRSHLLKYQARFAWSRGEWARARELHEEGIASLREAGDAKKLASMLREASFFERERGNLDRARQLALEGLAVSEEVGDVKGCALAHTAVGLVAMDRGDFVAARREFETALDASRRMASRIDQAILLHNLGEIALREGRLADAERAFAECLEIGRAAGAVHIIAYTECLLGQVAVATGEHDRAAALLESALASLEETHDELGVAYALEGIATAAAARGDAAGALRVAGAADAVRATIGKPRSADEEAALAPTLSGARDALGPERSRAEYDAGRATDASKAASLALAVLRAVER